MNSFTFNSSCIDLASEKIEEFLKCEKVTAKDIIRTKLMVEEALLRYRDVVGEEAGFRLECLKRFGRLRIELRVACDSLDPFASDTSSDNDILRGVLSGAGIIPTWQYKNGENLLVFSPKKKKSSQTVWLISAVLLALLGGGIFALLPSEWGIAVSEKIVTPIFDTFLGLLTALAGFVIFFSLTWGIIGIGDLSSFGKIGKKMISRIILMCGVLMITYVLLILPCFPLSFDGEASLGFSELFEMFLAVIPNNLVAPFVEGNLLQIVFIAVIIGIAMLVLGSKVSVVSSFVEQANNVVNLIMEGIGACIPFLVFISLFNMMINGSISEVFGSWEMVLLLIGGTFFSMLVYFLLCLRKKVRPMVLLKKLLPTFVIGLTTASPSAALATNMEICDKELGIDKKVIRFGIPLYQVLYMPVTAIEYFVILLSISEIYGIAISPMMLIMAAISILLLSIATPSIPGSGVAVLIILFSQFGIPAEAIAVAASVDIVLDFIITAGEIFCQQCELILLSSSLDMLDVDILRKEKRGKRQ